METEFIKRPKPLSLNKALKLSYMDDNKKKKKILKKYGYKLDEGLSSHNQTVAHNPFSSKLLTAVAGTHNYDDYKTDLQLALGNLKRTKRYNEAKETLKVARDKYKPKSDVIVGESLGGTITGYLPYDKNTRAFAVNSGATIGQQTRDRQGRLTNYRIKGDPISFLTAGHKFQNNLDVNIPMRGKTTVEKILNRGFDIHTQRMKGSKIMI